MTLGRCPLRIFCSRGTPTNPILESVRVPTEREFFIDTAEREFFIDNLGPNPLYHRDDEVNRPRTVSEIYLLRHGTHLISENAFSNALLSTEFTAQFDRTSNCTLFAQIAEFLVLRSALMCYDQL